MRRRRLRKPWRRLGELAPAEAQPRPALHQARRRQERGRPGLWPGRGRPAQGRPSRQPRDLHLSPAQGKATPSPAPRRPLPGSRSSLHDHDPAHPWRLYIQACAPCSPGLTPRAVFERLKAMQMVDVHLPTTDGRQIVLPRHTQPETDQQILLAGPQAHPGAPAAAADHRPGRSIKLTQRPACSADL